MQVGFVDGFNKSPSFSGVFFVNKDVLAKTGKTVVKEILDNEAVKQYTKRLDYDLFIRQSDEVTEWQVKSEYTTNFDNLPWVPILDSTSLTKSSVSGYISKFLPKKNLNNRELNYVSSGSEKGELVKSMELVENVSKYIRDMKERVEWLD